MEVKIEKKYSSDPVFKDIPVRGYFLTSMDRLMRKVGRCTAREVTATTRIRDIEQWDDSNTARPVEITAIHVKEL